MSSSLTFKALNYSSNRDKISVGQDAINLKLNSEGTYDVAENQVLIKIHSAALNPIDLVLYNSASPLLSYFFGKQGIGRDYSGTIEKIGASAQKKTDFNVGDEVCGMYSKPFGKGTCSEYVILDPTVDTAIVSKPKNLTMEEASSWPLVYGTAECMIAVREQLQKTKLKNDSKVLVIGGSTAVGRYLVQILSKKYNVRDIVAVCSPQSEQAVRELGATSIIDYTKLSQDQGGIYPPVQELAVTGKFDMVFDCVGNVDLLDDTRMGHVLKSDGDYASICGDVKGDYKDGTLLGYLATLGPFVRTLRRVLGRLPYNYQFVGVHTKFRWVDSAKELFENGSLSVQVDSVYDFNDFEKAIERLASNRAAGKVVIRVSS